jgi:hypothetical protein
VGYWEASGEVVEGCDGHYICTRSVFSFHLATQAVVVTMSRTFYCMHFPSAADRMTLT